MRIIQKFKKKIYPDHYEFKKGQILDIIKEANDKNYKIIMTEKDFIKLKNIISKR